MELFTEKTDDILMVLIPGETLDAGSAKEFKAAAVPFLTPGAKVVFDLSGLKFVDSSGLGSLLSCLRQLNAAGGDLKLCGTSKPVRALFELVRMHRVFELCNTREDAIRAFGLDNRPAEA